MPFEEPPDDSKGGVVPISTETSQQNITNEITSNSTLGVKESPRTTDGTRTLPV